jgi:pimeloyl-ACP methyl ester carboxylesterase
MLGVLLTFIKNPRTFLYRKDRSSIKFEDCAPNLTHEYHVVNGVKLHVVVAGRPQPGQPPRRLLLFVHGFPEGHFSWRHQLTEFQKEYEVAALDLRGYGASAKPRSRSAYRVFEIVQDMRELAEALGHPKFVLVAHDWGAVAAWQFAAYHQDMRYGLICMSAPPGELWMKNQDADQKKRSSYVWLFQAPLLPELLIGAHDLKAVEDAFTDTSKMGVRTPGALSPEDIERYKAQFSEPGALTAALNYYRAMVDSATWNPPPRRAKKPDKPFSVPTLVLYGDSDAALGPQLWKGLDHVVTGAQLHCLENCSHWVQQDKPQETNQLMHDFLQSLS